MAGGIFDVYTSERLESYKPFHDHKWAMDMDAKTRGDAIHREVSKLNALWMMASEAHSLPLTLFSKWRLYAAECGKAFNMVTEFEMLVQQDPAIKYGLASQLEKSFCSIYFAYDNFVMRCYLLMGGPRRVSTKKGHLEITTTSGQFKQLLSKIMREKTGNDLLYQECWHCKEVIRAKLARHAITHGGAFLNRRLKRFSAYYDTARSRVLIHDLGVYKLYANLKARAERLIEYLLANHPRPVS